MSDSSLASSTTLDATDEGQQQQQQQDRSSSVPIQTVTIVGGTHGNEYTGVWCIKAIERQRELYNNNRHRRIRVGEEGMMENNNNDCMMKNMFEMYPTIQIETLLANPVAHFQNKRFVHVDLNRQFGIDHVKNNDDDDDDNNNAPIEEYYEVARAREIETLLGKRRSNNNNNNNNNVHDDSISNDGVDAVIDLHTTTANMGITIILAEGYEPIMSHAAAYALYHCQQYYSTTNNNNSSSSNTSSNTSSNNSNNNNNNSRGVGVQCLIEEGNKFVDLSSCCGKHGITIEVGPVPQGVLRHDIVMQTQVALNSLLEYFHLHNVELIQQQQQQQQNEKRSVLHEQLMTIYPRGIVPCYRSSPGMKICWPTTTTTTDASTTDNNNALDNNNNNSPNFPTWMVHGSIQDRDFETVLHIGDPLFVSLDGTTVITYDGSSSSSSSSHNDTEIYPIFVNEGGYYYASSGMGIGIATRSHFDLRTCEFVDDNVVIDYEVDDGNDGNNSSSLSPHDVTSAPLLTTSPTLRSIGVDYGLVRTGLAVTSGGYSPCPLAILSGYINGTDLSTRIVDIVVSECATNVVLGLPLNKNGTASEQSELTRLFGKLLAMEIRKRCGHTTKVVLWDERYTSKEARSRIAAEAMARNCRIPGKKQLRGELDADCACIILENYYADEGWLHAEEIRLDEMISQECDVIYARNIELIKKVRLQRLEEQDRRRNARREMIDRDLALTKGVGGVEEDASSKRKKKKKKK